MDLCLTKPIAWPELFAALAKVGTWSAASQTVEAGGGAEKGAGSPSREGSTGLPASVASASVLRRTVEDAEREAA